MEDSGLLSAVAGYLTDSNVMLVIALWALASLSLLCGYWAGRDAWWVRFRVRMDVGFGPKTLSGFWSEWALITYVALLVLLVEALTPAIDLTGLVTQTWPFFPIMFAVTFGLVVMHELIEVRSARRAHSGDPVFVRELGRGYAPYTVFSTIIFCMFFMAALLVVYQFMADKQNFARQRAVLEMAFAAWHGREGTGAPVAVGMGEIERINGLLSAAIYAITEQVNTVLIVLYCVLLINLLIEFTPLRTAYSPNALIWTHAVVVAALLLVCATAAYLYATEYLGMIQRTIAELSRLEPRVRSESWEGTKRYYELLADLRTKQGFTGFILTISAGRGGVAFFGTALQMIYSTISSGRQRAVRDQLRRRLQHGTAGRAARRGERARGTPA